MNYYSQFHSHLHTCLIAFALMLSVLSCNKENAPDCFQSAGAYATTERKLAEFFAIELNDYIQYELCDTTFYGVVITAPRNLIPDIETEVNSGKLTIHNRNTCNFVRSFKKKITIRICAPSFSDVQNFSTGDISSVNALRSSKFHIESWDAAGVHRLEVYADTISIGIHTGVCDAVIRGKARDIALFNQGLGTLDARAVNASRAFVNNSSLNDVIVNSTEYLFTAIMSSGNVYYSGSPSSIDTDIQGQGRLISL